MCKVLYLEWKHKDLRDQNLPFKWFTICVGRLGKRAQRDDTYSHISELYAQGPTEAWKEGFILVIGRDVWKCSLEEGDL